MPPPTAPPLRVGVLLPESIPPGVSHAEPHARRASEIVNARATLFLMLLLLLLLFPPAALLSSSSASELAGVSSAAASVSRCRWRSAAARTTGEWRRGWRAAAGFRVCPRGGEDNAAGSASSSLGGGGGGGRANEAAVVAGGGGSGTGLEAARCRAVVSSLRFPQVAEGGQPAASPSAPPLDSRTGVSDAQRGAEEGGGG